MKIILIRNKMYSPSILVLIIATLFNGQNCQNNSYLNTDQYSTFLFQNTNIVSMQSDEILSGKDLLISNGIIQKIGVGIEPEFDTVVIDASGQYLMPALFDMHAHIGEENPFLTYQLGLYRYFGVHNVNLMAGNDSIISIKQSVGGQYNEELKTPHLHLASELIDGHPPLWGDQHNGPVLVDVDEVEQVLSELKEKGYSDIKVYDQLTEEVYLKILEVSQQMGHRVVGHVPTSLSLGNRLDVRQQRIDHLYGFWELAYDGDISELPGMSLERIEVLIDGFNEDKFRAASKQTADNNIWVVPTHVLYSALLDEDYADEIMTGEYSMWLDPSLQGWWSAVANDAEQMPHLRNEEFRDIHMHMISVLHEEGVRLLAGTDAPLPLLMYGRALHKELELFTLAGLSPFEAIKTATVYPAKYLGLSDLGIIAEGNQAEIIMLERNPLENITNTLSISGYFSENKYLSRRDMEEYLRKLLTDKF
jgi:hypothetical protein